MVFGDSLTKAGRLVELQRQFWKNPGRVLTTGELADRIDVPPRTVRKYLKELSGSGSLPIYKEGRGWRLAKGAQMEILPVRFQLEEAVAVYLAARLLTRHVGESSPAVQSAVDKMSMVVPSELREACSRLTDRAGPGNDSPAASVFRTLVNAWILHRVVSVTYASRTRGESHELEFRPYLIEPSALGSAVYVIGRADPPGDIRVMKFARIRTARTLQATFVPPPTAEILDRLDKAWAIWMTDDDPVEVRLRFSSVVASRLQETLWHPSQQLTNNADGSVEMRLAIASTVEIINWVLGWGANCEVIQPRELRDRIAAEHREAARVYR
jgi:predicted DNA-binding transcriptional regulator YafY